MQIQLKLILISIGAILSLLFIYLLVRPSCPKGDRKFCKVYRSFFQSEDFISSGTFSWSDERSQFNGTWTNTETAQQVTYEENQIDIVTVKDRVYVHDPSDGRWWMMRHEKFSSYETEFITNFKEYFTERAIEYRQEIDTIQLEEEYRCEDEYCIRYSAVLDDGTEDTLVFTRDGDIVSFQRQNNGKNLKLSFLSDDQEALIIEEPYRVKETPTGSNVLADLFQNARKPSLVEDKPDYIFELEKEIRAEEENSVSAPRYLRSLTPTVSISP